MHNSSDNNEHFKRQGSLRKVLLPEDKDNLFGRQNEDLNKFYKTFHQEYVILAEYKMVHSQNIQGVYVIPSRENPFVWFGVIFIRNGPYEDGIFRFNIILNENFPDSDHPKVVFLTETFHPVIDSENNELCLIKAFPTWNKSEQHIWQVLKYIHWIFYNLEHSIFHAINKNAEQLYRTDLEAFYNKVKALSKLSREHIYNELPNEDKHNLVFEQQDPEVLEITKKSMLSKRVDDNIKIGYSWVMPGSIKPLERSPTPDLENDS